MSLGALANSIEFAMASQTGRLGPEFLIMTPFG